MIPVVFGAISMIIYTFVGFGCCKCKKKLESKL